MKWAYYNENDPYCCEWLRNLIKAGLIADGEVDERSIKLVQPDDVRGFAQAHFFAGIGGWSYACRLAGWPDERPIFTGSCPCQPFSCAGKGRGTDDERHLWPDFFRLIRSCRPACVFGEQVAGKAGYGWLDGVRADLAREGYTSWGFDIPACAMDAPHRRSRIYWFAKTLADSDNPEWRADNPQWDDIDWSQAGRNQSNRDPEGCGSSGVALADAYRSRLAIRGSERSDHEAECTSAQRARRQPGCALGEPDSGGREAGKPASAPVGHGHSALTAGRNVTFWSDAEWLVGADGKARRVGVGIRRVDHGLSAGMDSLRPTEEAEAEARIPLLSHGEPSRTDKLRGLGNAIVPQLAAEVIRSFMECEP